MREWSKAGGENEVTPSSVAMARLRHTIRQKKWTAFLFFGGSLLFGALVIFFFFVPFIILALLSLALPPSSSSSSISNSDPGSLSGPFPPLPTTIRRYVPSFLFFVRRSHHFLPSSTRAEYVCYHTSTRKTFLIKPKVHQIPDERTHGLCLVYRKKK